MPLYEPADKGATKEGQELKDLLVNVKRAVWSLLYADDAGVVSFWSHGLAWMVPVIVKICTEFRNTVSEKAT